MQTPMLPIPNPQDWVDAYDAARLLDVDPSTVHRMGPNILTAYKLGRGRTRHYWRPEVMALRAARRLVRGAPADGGCE